MIPGKDTTTALPCVFADWADLARVLGVSEAPLVSRQQPSRLPNLAELTMIVRPPGNPLAIKTFTDAELADAEAYAREHGAEVERFPT